MNKSLLINYYNDDLIYRYYQSFCISKLNSAFSKFNDATVVNWVGQAASFDQIVKGAVEC